MAKGSCTCVDIIAFLWAHRGSTGLCSLLLFTFPANRTEGGGVAQGGEGGLERTGNKYQTRQAKNPHLPLHKKKKTTLW